MKLSEREVRPLVEKGTAVLTSPPHWIPSDLATDAPLLGNGDLGAVIGGDGAKQIFYLGKNDFWTQAHLAQTPQQRAQRLLNQEGRRSGTRIVAAGWLAVEIPQLKGCDYYCEQDPYLGEVRGRYRSAEAAAQYTSFICAEQNTLVVEVENTGECRLQLHFFTMPGLYETAEVYGYEDGVREDTVWVEYPAEPYSLKGGRWVYWNITCDRPAQYQGNKMVGKGGFFSLEPGEKGHIFLTMLSDLDAPDAKEQAYRLSVAARSEWETLRQNHRNWWMDYWCRSVVETGDETLDSFYYASLYLLASATRAGKVPPGLFGPWITTDRPKWTGSYTLNYNYESPFFCLYSANRQHLATSYIEPLLDIIPIGKLYAREKFHRPGICLPVEIGPWGTVCSSIFHHQKTNAAYCCCNIFMHYFTTLDQEWGAKAYPFVREVADFWEADLVWEQDRQRYSVVGDSLHEEYWNDRGEKNNTHALGLVRMVMKGILQMSEELGRDAEKRDKWKHILDHIADFPVFDRCGQKVFRFNEDSYAWRDGANGSSVKFIYPFNCIGLDSDPELLEIARNTLVQKDLFDNGNAFCEYTAMCARVGRDPQLLYDKLIEQCHLRAMPNKYIWHGGGGIEDACGVPNGINEMMLQSHENVLRIFPVWPKGKDARFANLRAYGAFLVSASIVGDEVGEIVVESEKGRSLTIMLPWQKTEVICSDGRRFMTDRARLTLETTPGESIRFIKGEPDKK